MFQFNNKKNYNFGNLLFGNYNNPKASAFNNSTRFFTETHRRGEISKIDRDMFIGVMAGAYIRSLIEDSFKRYWCKFQ